MHFPILHALYTPTHLTRLQLIILILRRRVKIMKLFIMYFFMLLPSSQIRYSHHYLNQTILITKITGLTIVVTFCMC
jgi:hypothetical protein